jgi:hypothetical protein
MPPARRPSTAAPRSGAARGRSVPAPPRHGAARAGPRPAGRRTRGRPAAPPGRGAAGRAASRTAPASAWRRRGPAAPAPTARRAPRGRRRPPAHPVRPRPRRCQDRAGRRPAHRRARSAGCAAAKRHRRWRAAAPAAAPAPSPHRRRRRGSAPAPAIPAACRRAPPPRPSPAPASSCPPRAGRSGASRRRARAPDRARDRAAARGRDRRTHPPTRHAASRLPAHTRRGCGSSSSAYLQKRQRRRGMPGRRRLHQIVKSKLCLVALRESRISRRQCTESPKRILSPSGLTRGPIAVPATGTGARGKAGTGPSDQVRGRQ